MIELEFLGAARTVTGSKHLLRTSRARVLLDCGLFQGHRAESLRRNHELPLGGDEVDAVVLSHAHIDHSGALPLLYKHGYRGPVYATPATRDLCAPMLLDAANIQTSDAAHIARLIERGVDLEPVQPLYDRDDVAGLLSQMISMPYRRRFNVAPGVDVTFLDAGHVLGSAIVVLDVEDEGRAIRLAFSGDLGRPHLPILRDPQVPDGVTHLLLESTYGDRLHGPFEESTAALGEVVRRTCARGGKVLVPTFALERTQEILYALNTLSMERKLPDVPVYVDSPLAVKLTDVFRMHPECYDTETRALLESGHSPFELRRLHYVASVEESKAIDRDEGPAIILAASGMCEGGRVLHHLSAFIGDPNSTIAIVGFQAQHTLGRRLVERRPEVRILGVMRERLADVAVLDGFSAHADQKGLVEFAEATASRGSLRQIVLVHGEGAAQDVLAKLLHERNVCGTVDVPDLGDRLALV